MSITASEMTPADIRAVTDGNNGGYGGMGWGGDWATWIIVFLIFGMFGWGGNGWGGGFGGGNGAGVVDGYVLASDFSNIERKIDSVNNGICDGFYAMNTGMLNGFAGVNQNISNGFQAAELSRCNQQAALMQQLFGMQMAQQNCCCENREAIAQVRYDLAQQGCDTRNTIQNVTRDIIDNQNNNSRAIMDYLTTTRMQDLQSENQALKLAASQAVQNNTIKGYVAEQFAYYNPRPVPAYQVQNPNCCYGNGYGCGAAA